MTEKMFYWIETELSRTHNHSFRSVIKDLMSSCYIPWPQEVPQLVKSYDHTASIFRKESGQGDWCGGLELIFSLTCHCVSCEVITSGVYFGVAPTVCLMIMFYCVIVLYDGVPLCDLNLCVFLVFCPSRHQTVTQWRWLLFSFCSSPRFSAGRWVSLLCQVKTWK